MEGATAGRGMHVSSCEDGGDRGPVPLGSSGNVPDSLSADPHCIPHRCFWSAAASAPVSPDKLLIGCTLQVGDVTHYFEARTVQRMELLVLSTLEWRMSAITPFSYIDYYFAKLGIDNTIVRSLLLRVIDLLLGTLRGEPHPQTRALEIRMTGFTNSGYGSGKHHRGSCR